MNRRNTPESWIEFSLVVEEEQADSVTDALAGILPAGLVAERLYGDVFPDQLALTRVPVRIFGYLPADEELDRRKAQIAAALRDLPGMDSFSGPDYSILKNENWATAWQERYRPIALGKNLVIVPSWLKNPHPERLAIVMDPDMAFGSGTHPTTQLCLVLLEQCLAEAPFETMLDIGCGSGILAIAAVSLGAGRALGVDNDPEVIRIAEDNARRNQVGGQAAFSHGSVAEIQGGKFGITEAPLVAANIIAPILTQLFRDGLGGLVSPGGSLILSGILQEQRSGMLEVLDQNGFLVRDQLSQEEWLALRAVKPGIQYQQV